jgi:uncharacterized membrane-anchored protein YhcB (DUF1043 family)
MTPGQWVETILAFWVGAAFGALILRLRATP